METSPQSDTCLLHDFQGQSIWIVTTEIHCFYTSIDNHLGTRSTRWMSAVEAGPSDIRALVCRLDNGILLRVQPPTEFVPLPRGNSHCLPQTTTLRTVLQSPRRSVISGGQNLPLPHLICAESTGSHCRCAQTQARCDRRGTRISRHRVLVCRDPNSVQKLFRSLARHDCVIEIDQEKMIIRPSGYQIQTTCAEFLRQYLSILHGSSLLLNKLRSRGQPETHGLTGNHMQERAPL